MTVELYQNESENNRLNKTITKIKDSSIVLLDDSDVTRFRMKIKDLPENCNYMYIPTFNRFYFVSEINRHYNGFVIASLNVDVLMTYKQQITNNECKIVESENIVDADKIDYVSKNVENVTEYKLNNPFNSKSDIMVTVQGV